MSVSVTTFLEDFPEFNNKSAYPASAINYWLAIAQLFLNATFWGAASPVAAQAPPTVPIDFATELFVAHNLVLQKQALDAASRGGDPGTKQGVVASKSVGGVSISYSVSEVLNPDGSFWNATNYGVRLLYFARLFGSGPIQIGVSRAPLPFLVFAGDGSVAWAGPYPGIEPSDTGFG